MFIAEILEDIAKQKKIKSFLIPDIDCFFNNTL